MARFVLEIQTSLSPLAAWTALWDLRAHDRFIPATRLTGHALGTPGQVADALGVGSEFTATTSCGPLRVHDVMRIVEWQPPASAPEPTDRPRVGRACVSKAGRVVRGRIDATVSPAPGGAVARWEQDISIARVPRLADPLVAAVARAAYGVVLRRLLRP